MRRVVALADLSLLCALGPMVLPTRLEALLRAPTRTVLPEMESAVRDVIAGGRIMPIDRTVMLTAKHSD